MRILSKKKKKSGSTIIDKPDKKITKIFDFILCAGVALTVGYLYAKLNM